MNGHDNHALMLAYYDSCIMEVQAFKPGNVSIWAAGHGMSATDFYLSAWHSATPITAPDLRLGARILAAVTATHAAVGTNTNLGIVLLCAPLIQARLDHPDLALNRGLKAVLADTTVADAEAVYQAIRIASPGGLGSDEQHDVAQAARITLLDAMVRAADRDQIGALYATGFARLFDEVLPYFRKALEHYGSTPLALADLFLNELGRHPDSHIARKAGLAQAEKVSALAREYHPNLHGVDSEESLVERLKPLDEQLKRESLNPGTSADICAACLLTHRLLQRADNSLRKPPETPRVRRPKVVDQPVFNPASHIP